MKFDEIDPFRLVKISLNSLKTQQIFVVSSSRKIFKHFRGSFEDFDKLFTSFGR